MQFRLYHKPRRLTTTEWVIGTINNKTHSIIAKVASPVAW